MTASPFQDLLLRPWAVSDAAALRAAIDEDVAHLRPWLTWTLEEPTCMARTRERIRWWLSTFESGQGYRFAIVPEERPALILGGVTLNNRFEPNAHDAGYWVRRSATRRGVASAAMARLTVHGFEERAVGRLVLQIDRANAASLAFGRRLGFVPTGEVTNSYPDGSPRPVHRLELAASRYATELAPRLRQLARRVRLVGL